MPSGEARAAVQTWGGGTRGAEPARRAVVEAPAATKCRTLDTGELHSWSEVWVTAAAWSTSQLLTLSPTGARWVGIHSNGLPEVPVDTGDPVL